MSSTATIKPAIPRPSASLIIINQRSQVLLVQRNPESRSYGGFTVFPGGNFDKEQDSSFQITAIRETFEESGLLLASPTTSSSPALTDAFLDEARTQIHTKKLLFQDFLANNGLKPDIDLLLPFTEWITPVNNPRRFHTRFYVSFLSSSSGFISGQKQERIPKPDGGLEVISARFLHPHEALDEFRQGKITFMPPQYYLLYTLSQIFGPPPTGSLLSPEHQKRIRMLADGNFGHMGILPRQCAPMDSHGRMTFIYPGDEEYGGPRGRQHRATVTMTKKKTASDIQLYRNFDIFSEIPAQRPSSKL